MFNQEHELSVEELRHILQLPIYGPSGIPKEFDATSFWCSISDDPYYTAVGGKVSLIQNPCFRYAQKELAYTLLGRGDSTKVAIQRELFFLHFMVNNGIVNIVAFTTNYLGKVSREATRDISVGGMIIQIIKFLVSYPKIYPLIQLGL